MEIDKKLILEALRQIKSDVDVLGNLIATMPEDLQWELTKQTDGAMQSANTDPPNSPEWHRKRAKLQEAAFMKGQELFKSGNFERRA